MSELFPPDTGLVIVPVQVVGPRNVFTFRCIIDTGAERTVLSAALLRRLGFDLARPVGRARLRSATGHAPVPLVSLGIVPAANARRGRIRSATGGAAAPFVAVPHLLALGRPRDDFDVLAHDLPPSVTHDGLLGLDFYRGLVLKLDFARGRAALKPPRRWWQFWR